MIYLTDACAKVPAGVFSGCFDVPSCSHVHMFACLFGSELGRRPPVLFVHCVLSCRLHGPCRKGHMPPPRLPAIGQNGLLCKDRLMRRQPEGRLTVRAGRFVWRIFRVMGMHGVTAPLDLYHSHPKAVVLLVAGSMMRWGHGFARKKEMYCCWHTSRSIWILSACSLPGGLTHSGCATA